MTVTAEPEDERRTRLALEALVSPVGGLFSRVVELAPRPGSPRVRSASALLGDISHVFDNIAEVTAGRSNRGQIDGTGGGGTGERARLVAMAEALERYSSCAWSDDTFIWATADELGHDALDLTTLPSLSARELADPRCPLRPVDLRAPIRWVRGACLRTRRPVWIPAVLAYLHCPPKSAGERIAHGISTGCAAHTDLHRALIGGLCEVLERDAISLVWHQQLALPRIDPWSLPPDVAAVLAPNRSTGARIHVFDATTDLGVPTVYGLELVDHDRIAQLVMCSTELDPTVAVTKVLREAAASRVGLEHTGPCPDDPALFHDVMHGAVHMGHPDRRAAFDFLTGSPARTSLAVMPHLDTGDPAADLDGLVDRLHANGMHAYAVDLTTDEARDAGFWVVRAVVPELQPLSFVTTAQFKGHPRLYDGPARMGHPVRSEADLNPHPQPFA